MNWATLAAQINDMSKEEQMQEVMGDLGGQKFEIIGIEFEADLGDGDVGPCLNIYG